MRQAQHLLTVETTGQGFYDLTRPVGDWVAGQSVVAGLTITHIFDFVRMLPQFIALKL